MPTTTNGLTYPAATATPDVPRDIQQLATDLETKIGQLLGSVLTTHTPTLVNVTGGTAVGRVARFGKLGFIDVEITAGTVTAAASVTVSLPAGWTADAAIGATIPVSRGSVTAHGRIGAGGTTIILNDSAGAVFTAALSLVGTRITGWIVLA